jgi:TonB family protein
MGGRTVVLQFKVGSDGRASSVEVAQSSGHEILDEAAKECLTKWMFRSDEIGTNTMQVPIAFKLAP